MKIYNKKWFAYSAIIGYCLIIATKCTMAAEGRWWIFRGSSEVNSNPPPQVQPVFGDRLKNKLGDWTSLFTWYTGLSGIDLPVLIGIFLQMLLSLLGMMFIGLIIYGGYKWMMAKGDESDVEKARGIIRHSIIGLIVVMSSYAIGYFFLYWVITGGGGLGRP